MNLLGESCPAKEVIIAVQEAIERLVSVYDTGEDKFEVESNETLSVPTQLATLVGLYASCKSTNCTSLDSGL